MGKYFGTDGFRGEANINLTVEHAYKVGRYIGWYFNQKSSSRAKIVIGKDTRRSSYMFENALVAGLTASGADAYMLYVTTTPSVAYVVRTEQFDCGIMISASHNPYYDNGIKLINAKGHLDVGFAYDGDADRCIAVDENGQVVDGDLILYVCGQYLKKHGDLNNNTVVTTVMSNLGLYKAFDAAGIAYEKTAVGDKYVNENMVKNGHALGGEQSGHIIFSKFATTGDGILTSLKIMEAMIEQKQSLAQLAEPVEIFPQILENVRVYDKAVAQADEDVQKAVKEVEVELGDEGRILVRESGTEPLVRVMVEARSHEICREKVDKVVKVLREKGHVIK